MDITTSLIVIAFIYGIFLFLDNFFKSCAHYPYIKFLEGTGFKIQFLTIKWQTKAFNRTIIRWGNSRLSFFNIWFNLGLYASLILVPIAVIMLLYSVFQNFITKKQQHILLEPVIPGLNLPASELGYYSGTLIVASIVHELGHALAAVLDDVNLIEVGANIFFILPVAYVNLSTEKLFNLEGKKTLRIMCAGIWHNIVLSVIGIMLYCLLPVIFSMIFHVNRGITITQIAKNSPILGPRGLVSGDTVFRINDCEVSDENSWYTCLNQVKDHQTGFCIDPKLVHSLDESIPLKYSVNGNLDCCDGTKSENICFEYLDSNDDGILELPSHVCLPGRKVVEESPTICTQSPHICPNNRYCFRPILSNFTYLIKLSCKDKLVVYLGYPIDISRSIEVSSYIPNLVFKTTDVPDIMTKFIKYLTIISFGLALVNVMPLSYMDGQYIMEIIVYMLLREKLGNKKCKLIVATITTFFTLILILHCLYFFYNNFPT
ncbi:unnamed protein product [Psylliodes chrysocephalus]|uniref:Membrane-bound transcription factor site-2 protease n=1 Tax=Psylliodes chrysocephalus TaxID=3402493 RepID=A0A9P0D4J4_9CUCU|nr:unnamed protein product [Psylliodes chrysocephala]